MVQSDMLKKETGENIYPGLAILAGCGVIDICGMQRPETGWNRIIWGLQDKPVIAVDPVINGKYKRASSMWRNTDAVESWSWEGCEGCKTNVTVYTSAPKAELYCNGKRIASAKVKECKAVFKKGLNMFRERFLPLCMMKTVKKLTGQSCFPPLEKQ